jgi:hypothetical protein
LLVTTVLLVLAFGHFVVRPAAERLAQGLGGLAAAIATQAAAALSQTHALACQAIEQDVLVQELLGGHVTCAPVEEVTWLEPYGGEIIEFQVVVTGDTGQQGTASVVASLQPAGPRLESIVISGDEGGVLLLPLP